MNLYEFQGKELFKKVGIHLPFGKMTCTPDEAVLASEQIKGHVCVVKAQVLAGGRGKAGGVKVVNNLEEVRDFAQRMIANRLVTNQTGKDGELICGIYVEEGVDIDQELYLSLVLDSISAQVVVIACREGGVDIEEVANKTPQKIFRMPIDFVSGVQGFHGRDLVKLLGLDLSWAPKFYDLLKKLYELFLRYDAQMVEINPLVITKDEKLVPLDAKISIDDNALYRHKDFLEIPVSEDPVYKVTAPETLESRAKAMDLSYVQLDGSIACMVNGAGLAMATMDIIKFHGGEPANFLDVGGGATKERVEAAFSIIASDKKVESILVNIFGGIMRCDIIAEGIVAAAKNINLKKPIVARLQGTNKELGRKILEESGLKIIPVETLQEAAQKVIFAAWEK